VSVNFDLAACRKPENKRVDFYPDPRYPVSSAPAKAVCAGCPVRAECLATNGHEMYGVIGGLSERERWYWRRKQLVTAGRAT
jgi:WhiB family redox-sensing transcriptional regulator